MNCSTISHCYRLNKVILIGKVHTCTFQCEEQREMSAWVYRAWYDGSTCNHRTTVTVENYMLSTVSTHFKMLLRNGWLSRIKVVKNILQFDNPPFLFYKGSPSKHSILWIQVAFTWHQVMSRLNMHKKNVLDFWAYCSWTLLSSKCNA